MSSQEQWKASQKARGGAELDVPWAGEFDNETFLGRWAREAGYRYPEALDAAVYGPPPIEEPPLATYDYEAALHPGDDDGA
jgi:hypothetical protein